MTNELKFNSVLISELYNFIIVRISELVNNFCTDFRIYCLEVYYV
nr:MAG TPA: hypothetical protein [Caudoviricetes sp.]